MTEIERIRGRVRARGQFDAWRAAKKHDGVQKPFTREVACGGQGIADETERAQYADHGLTGGGGV